MENNSKQSSSNDFIKTLKFLKGLTTVFLIFGFIALLASAISPMIAQFFPNTTEKGIRAVGLGFAVYIKDRAEGLFPKAYSNIAFFAGLSALLQGVIILMIVRSIFNDIIKNGSPFMKSVCKKIKVISLLILVYMAWGWLIQTAAYFALTNQEFLGFEEAGFKFASSVSMDFSPMLLAGIIYVLSYIFQYGVSLKEDNESIV